MDAMLPMYSTAVLPMTADAPSEPGKDYVGNVNPQTREIDGAGIIDHPQPSPRRRVLNHW